MNLMYTTTISLQPLTYNILKGVEAAFVFSPKGSYWCPSINVSKDKSWRRKGERNHGFIYPLFIFCYILYVLGDGKTVVCGGVLGEKRDARNELLI